MSPCRMRAFLGHASQESMPSETLFSSCLSGVHPGLAVDFYMDSQESIPSQRVNKAYTFLTKKKCEK